MSVPQQQLEDRAVAVRLDRNYGSNVTMQNKSRHFLVIENDPSQAAMLDRAFTPRYWDYIVLDGAYSPPSPPDNVAGKISEVIVTDPKTVGLGGQFLWTHRLQGLPPLPNATTKGALDISVQCLGFTNIVDQAGQPIPREKLVFYAVSPNGSTGTPSVEFPLDPTPVSENPPQLFIQAVEGGQVALSWPATAFGFSLESASDVQGGSWFPILDLPAVSGDRRSVTIKVTAQAQFYRLRSQ